MSLRSVPALLGPTGRAMRWRPFLTAAGVGLAVVAVPAASSVLLSTENWVNLLRAAGVCGALGATFLLDDPARGSLVAAPVGRLTRYAVRFGLALLAVAAWWAAVVVIAVAGAVAGPLPLGGTTVEAAAILAVGLGLAVLSGRDAPDGTGSTAAVVALLLLTSAAAFLPGRAAPFVSPADPRWPAVHGWWAVALAVAAAAAVLAGREPAR